MSPNKIAIKADNIRKSYANIPALKGISFEVQDGEIVAFLGPNGAGKTTAINILIGLIKADFGEIYYDGTLFQPENTALKRIIGVVPQHNNLERDLTVEENLRIHALLFGIKDDKKCIDNVLEIVGLQDRKQSKAVELSGGMKRRIVIARALMHEPKILFLDEPSTGLDPVSRRNIHSLVRKLNKEMGVCVFLTTHYIEEAESLAHKVLFIDNGEIVASGKPNDLKATIGKYALEYEDNGKPAILYFGERAEAIETAAKLSGDMLAREVTLEDVYLKHTGKRSDTPTVPSLRGA